ncbi:aspartate aminotransferase family protein [Nocardioides sp.]|uniref:aspartate aminotransferase family protein n=1 Tax=Nocardioides sp. TaxID=35761 RepID=UPI00262F670E|nr:aspartate aminotransferase family protein [Nocardioides sp.]
MSNAETLALDPTYVFHSWSAQGALKPLVIAGGEGAHVWDAEGRRLLDFSSQLVNVNIGFGHPAVVEAIQRQAATLATIAPATANHERGVAARMILDRAPAGFAKVFFTNGGADANENAIRMARAYTGREKVLSTYRSYHGNTGAAIAATGDWRRPAGNEFSRAHVHFFGPYLYRSEFWASTPEQESERALRHLRRTIEAEGPATIAALLIESIPGTAGILMPPPGYLSGVRALADEFGIVLITDEVMAGFGRTGQWLALDAYDYTPDLITFAKGVNSGYVPVGGVIISEPISAHFDARVFPGGLTYSGHPLAMASINATLGAMESEGIVTHARRIGEEIIAPTLAGFAQTYDVVGEVRGTGVFHAIELVSDRDARTPLDAATMGRIKAALLERDLLPFVQDNRIHVVPPCIVSEDEARTGLAIIGDVLATL